MRLSALQAALAEHGQRLSLDPPGDPTIGALLAENVSGPLRHRFGAPRDLVLGVTLVLGGRDDRERGRQGREERRRLRPRAPRLRLARTARADRARELPAAPAAEGDADARRRDRGRAAARSRPCSARSSSRARSTSSTPVASPCSSRARERAVEAQLDGRAALVGGAEADVDVWDESARAPGRGAGHASASTRAGSPSALAGPRRSRRPPGGRGRVRAERAQVSSSQGPIRRRVRRAASSGSARELDPKECSPDDPRADLGLRPLRLLPADVPDVRPLERGDGLAARADPPDGRAARRDGDAERDRHRALRPLPRLHGVRQLVPVGRALRPADRDDARRRRAGARARAGRPAPPRAPLPRPSRTPAACARRSGSRRSDESLPLPRQVPAARRARAAAGARAATSRR